MLSWYSFGCVRWQEDNVVVLTAVAREIENNRVSFSNPEKEVRNDGRHGAVSQVEAQLCVKTKGHELRVHFFDFILYRYERRKIRVR